ncbi:hypothetical protein FLA_6064 [Filimonas lacunae]|nr:hypothetical protein FLA_6064 [Filimonas lacunae]
MPEGEVSSKHFKDIFILFEFQILFSIFTIKIEYCFELFAR